MKPEDKARVTIDKLLEAADWDVQDYKQVNLSASVGVAVRYFPLKNQKEADYILFVDRKACGVIEAKKEGVTLSGVAEQSKMYQELFPDDLPLYINPLPFAYESTGVETQFSDNRDPNYRSRRVFGFHTPEELKHWLDQDSTLRYNLTQLPELNKQGLYDCQVDAITGLEDSLRDSKPRSLIQMATGSGKTFAAVSSIYRLIKFGKAKRVLFLVDRNTLGRQAKREFMSYRTPDDGRLFTELYNVQNLTSNIIDPVNRVVITTIQRLFSMLKGDAEIDEELDEKSAYELSNMTKPVEVQYNRNLPIGFFDLIITDECHRSIYNLWRQVLEYFDSFLIGLTATPGKQTLGFFDQNLVTEYSHERAVADGINVGYEVYRIKTEIGEKGSKVDAGYYVDRRDKQSRRVRWEQLDEDLEYKKNQLDKDVVAKDQIRTVIKAFKDKCLPEIFPDRTEVPKTLIFAKDDSHAEDIVGIVREEFGKGNEFCKKITYRTTGEKPDDLIASFRNSYNPRIAVTVDMISTGTDIKPLEILIFMRDIRSRTYFEQMKGRGTRIIKKPDLQKVTPDAKAKTHFVIVDAVGVCESDKTDSLPIERIPTIPFDKLLNQIALGNREPDMLTTLAGRLSRLDKQIDDKDRKEILNYLDGKDIRHTIRNLLDSVDPDIQNEKASEKFNTVEPTEEQIKEIAEELTNDACKPFDNPDFRNTLIEIKKKNEQTIDTVSKDKVTFAGFDANATEKAKQVVGSFKEFIEQNKDEIMALQIIYNRPYGQTKLTTELVEQLSDELRKPPYSINSDVLWRAYKRLEKDSVKGAGVQRVLTDLISLVKHGIGYESLLIPFPESVEQRFNNWLKEQKRSGKEFTEEQLAMLNMIKDHIASSASISKEDFELTPFQEAGGLYKIYQLFGEGYEQIIEELNNELVA